MAARRLLQDHHTATLNPDRHTRKGRARHAPERDLPTVMVHQSVEERGLVPHRRTLASAVVRPPVSWEGPSSMSTRWNQPSLASPPATGRTAATRPTPARRPLRPAAPEYRPRYHRSPPTAARIPHRSEVPALDCSRLAHPALASPQVTALAHSARAPGPRFHQPWCTQPPQQRPPTGISPGQGPFSTWRVMDSNQRRTTPTVLQGGHEIAVTNRDAHLQPPSARSPHEQLDLQGQDSGASSNPGRDASRRHSSLMPN
jgi:hypothetical protein